MCTLFKFITDYPKLDVTPEIQTRFDSNTSVFYLGCDWSGFSDNDTNLTIIAQWYQDDVLITERDMERNVTSTEIAHMDFTGITYGKRVNMF